MTRRERRKGKWRWKKEMRNEAKRLKLEETKNKTKWKLLKKQINSEKSATCAKWVLKIKKKKKSGKTVLNETYGAV